MIRNKSDEIIFRKELKRVRKNIAWQNKYLPAAKKYNLTDEVNRITELLEKFTAYESQLVNILDGIKMEKRGDVYFTKDANARYKKR